MWSQRTSLSERRLTSDFSFTGHCQLPYLYLFDWLTRLADLSRFAQQCSSTTAQEMPHWFKELSSLSTKSESITEFRRRLNISDKAPQLERSQFKSGTDSTLSLYSFLTIYKRIVEGFFTPKYFWYQESYHRPIFHKFTLRLQNLTGKWVHYFYPTNNTKQQSYAVEYNQGDHVNVFDPSLPSTVIKGSKSFLHSLESHWETTSETLEKQIHCYRLLTPSHNDVFFR